MSLHVPFVNLRVWNIVALVRAARVTNTTFEVAAGLLRTAANDHDAALTPTLHSWYKVGAVAHMTCACNLADALGFWQRVNQRNEVTSIWKILAEFL